MALHLSIRTTPTLDSRPPVVAIPDIGVQTFVVWLHDGSFFRRSHPVSLSLDPQGGVVRIAEFTLASGTFTVTRALSPKEVNINASRLNLTIGFVHPTHDDAPEKDGMNEWNKLVGMLHLFSWSPSGFVLLEPLGTGETAVVFRALHVRDKKQVAVKEIRHIDLHHAHIPPAQAVLGVGTLRNVPYHPRLVKPKLVFWERHALFQIMPLARAGSLRAALRAHGGRLPSCLARGIVRDLLVALAHLHSHGVAHRNVSVDHILLTEGPASLFASARRHDKEKGGVGIEMRGAVDDDDACVYEHRDEASWPTAGVQLCGFGRALACADISHINMHMRAHAARGVPSKTNRRGNHVIPNARTVSEAAAADVLACGSVLRLLLYGDINRVCATRGTKSNLEPRRETALGDVAIDGRPVPIELRSLLSGLLQPSVARRLTARGALEHPAFNKPRLAIRKALPATTKESPASSRKMHRVPPHKSFRVVVRKLVSVVSLVDAWQETAGISRPSAMVVSPG